MPYNNFCNDMVSPLYVSLNGLWDYYLLRKPYHTDFTYIVSSQHVISNALWDNNLLRKPYHIGCIGIVSLLCVTNMFYKTTIICKSFVIMTGLVWFIPIVGSHIRDKYLSQWLHCCIFFLLLILYWMLLYIYLFIYDQILPKIMNCKDHSRLILLSIL